MEGQIQRSSLLNVYSGSDCVNSGGVLTITGLMAIKTASITSLIKQVSVLEVQQVVTIGSGSSPVVTAATKYQIKMGAYGGTVREGAINQLLSFGYTSPYVLSGSAATDRYNLFSALANKINNTQSAYATAYSLITITQTNVSPFAVGEIVTQSVSGATGIVVSGTTGTLTLGVISGTFTSASATLTGSISGSASATAATIVLGLGLRIVDDAGYYAPYTSQSFERGPNEILVTQGFAQTDLVVTTAGVLGVGQGTRMLANVPVRELTSGNLAQGYWSFPTNNPPLAGDHYTTYVITSTLSAFQDSLSDNAERHEVVQILYIDENVPNTGTGTNAGYAAVVAVLAPLLT